MSQKHHQPAEHFSPIALGHVRQILAEVREVHFGVPSVGGQGRHGLQPRGFVLVDRQGMIRGYYGGTEDEELKRLSADAKKLL